MSRKYKKKEVHEMFLKHVTDIAEYWGNLEGKSDIERTHGVVHSILALIDGGNINLPQFILAPLPDPSDKEYLIGEGENYFPENHKIESKIKANISGDLHEIFSVMRHHKKEIEGGLVDDCI